MPFGDKTFPEPTDLVARIHLEPEVREPGTSPPRVDGPEREREAVGVVDDDDTVGVPASRRGIEPEEPSV